MFAYDKKSQLCTRKTQRMKNGTKPLQVILFMLSVSLPVVLRAQNGSAKLFSRSPVVKGVLTLEERDQLTPAKILQQLKEGNHRFRTNKTLRRDLLAQAGNAAGAQFPKALLEKK